LRCGELQPLTRGLARLIAPNASVMTGPGTNTYLLGDPFSAVLDPGPDDAQHFSALLAAVPRLEYVFVTHTHTDHSPLATKLARATGAQLVGRHPPRDGRQDTSFVPDVEPTEHQRFDLGSMMLQAVFTPGHASNHVCYLLEPGAVLLSGDHILDGVTPVILAPDGDMRDYLASLRRLLAMPLLAIAPGHGRLLGDPSRVIGGVIEHRLQREAKVRRALSQVRGGTLDALLEFVYDDVPVAMHRWARLTLEAHLIKLQRDGDCRCVEGRWFLSGPHS
jgi:glyoxylase-like metal-dependent hydrolase (beta-lactamase superfamily II)